MLTYNCINSQHNPWRSIRQCFLGKRKLGGLEEEHDTLEISAKLTHPKGLLGVFQRLIMPVEFSCETF